MRTYRLAILAAIAAIGLSTMALGLSAHAQEFPERSGYVSDYAGVIGEEAKKTLEETLSRIQREYGVEIYILTVKETAPLAISEYSNQIFERWKLGKQDPKRRVLLFLVAVEEGLVRLATSRGLQDVLPDAQLAKVLQETILPAFHVREFERGIIKGVEQIEQYLASQHIQAPRASGEQRPKLRIEDLVGIALMIAGLALILLAGVIFS